MLDIEAVGKAAAIADVEIVPAIAVHIADGETMVTRLKKVAVAGDVLSPVFDAALNERGFVVRQDDRRDLGE